MWWKMKVSDSVITTYREAFYIVDINDDWSAIVKKQLSWQIDVRKSEYLSDILRNEYDVMNRHSELVK